MQIRQFRLVLKAKNFDRTCRFYGEVLALPRLQSWEGDDGRGALFQAGNGAIEVHGRARESGPATRDEEYDFQGPGQKLAISLVVPSAEKAYEEALFRNSNIPGGLTRTADGAAAFATNDPDGVKILLREPG